MNCKKKPQPDTKQTRHEPKRYKKKTPEKNKILMHLEETDSLLHLINKTIQIRTEKTSQNFLATHVIFYERPFVILHEMAVTAYHTLICVL